MGVSMLVGLVENNNIRSSAVIYCRIRNNRQVGDKEATLETRSADSFHLGNNVQDLQA